MDINYREGDTYTSFAQEGVKGVLMEAEALAGEAFHSVAVHCVVELALGRDDKHLARYVKRLDVPLHTVWEHHESVSVRVEPIDKGFAA